MSAQVKSCKVISDDKERLKGFDHLFSESPKPEKSETGKPANWSIELAAPASKPWLPPRSAFQWIFIVRSFSAIGKDGREDTAPVLRVLGGRPCRWRISTGCMHGSRGQSKPASPHLLSEPKIVAGMAKATVTPNPLVPWDERVSDYSKVRDAIAKTYPDIFHDFNARNVAARRLSSPAGARHRKWETKTGKANFIVPDGLELTLKRRRAAANDGASRALAVRYPMD